MTRYLVWTGVLVAAVVHAQQSPPQPMFRAVAESVLLPVAVLQNGRPVRGLVAADFEVLDNGEPQRVDVASLEALPLDVTVLTDISGSITAEAHARFDADLQQVAASLPPTDRLRVIGFGNNVLELSAWSGAAAPAPRALAPSGAGTSFYDALATALLTPGAHARPHLVVAFTDGRDTTSVLGVDDVAALAEHTLATLFVSIVRTQEPFRPVMVPWTGMLDLRRLRTVVGRTGGEVLQQNNADARAQVFQRILTQYRTMYLLRFTPTGVERGGWHALTVRVPAHDYRVTARPGYR